MSCSFVLVVVVDDNILCDTEVIACKRYVDKSVSVSEMMGRLEDGSGSERRCKLSVSVSFFGVCFVLTGGAW